MSDCGSKARFARGFRVGRDPGRGLRLKVVRWVVGVATAIGTIFWVAGHPVAAIWAFACVIFLAAVEPTLWIIHNTQLLIIPAFGCLLTAIGVFYCAHRLARQASLPVETETHGWLIPANEPRPANDPCGRDSRPSAAMTVYFGPSASWTVGMHEVLIYVGGKLLSMDRKPNGQVAITGDVFDSSGNLIARIKDGEFHLVGSEIAYPERSEDRSALTVYDRKGNKALYVHLLNPSALLILGVFNAPNGRARVIATEDKLIALTFDDQGKVQGRITINGGCSRTTMSLPLSAMFFFG